MANDYSSVATRWVDIVTGKTDKPALRNPRMPIGGDRIFSYGSHFEIARPLRTPKGELRAFLLNGNRFSPTTTKHQTHVRNAIRQSGMPSVIIPHDALASAGIDLDTIQLIDVSQDTTETIDHVTYHQPEGSVWRTVDVMATVDLTDEEVQAKLDKQHARAMENYRNAVHHYEWRLREIATNPESYYGKLPNPEPTEPAPPTRDDLIPWELTEYRPVGTETVLFRTARKYSDRIDVEVLDDGRTRYSWQTSRHLLGESLIRARCTWTQTTRCKACRGTGRNPGRCESCWGRGTAFSQHSRWSFYLSGFDHQEPTQSYFFCELPRGAKPTTVAEAYDALKPEPVKLAEQMGRTVYRQGDVFAIELKGIDKRTLRKTGARFEKRGTLLGQNHEATEVAYLPDGTTLARGVLWHNPAGRRPDHVRVKLSDKRWHVVVKNTCPIAV